MKKRFLICFILVALFFNLQAQDIGIHIHEGALLSLNQGSLVHAQGGFSNKGGEIRIEGNLKINGKFGRNDLENSKEENSTLEYRDDQNYGQLILSEDSPIEGTIKIEYQKNKLENQGNDLVFFVLPFNENFNLNKLIINLFGQNSSFYDSGLREKDSFLHSSLFKFSRIKQKWAPVKNETGNFDPSLLYGLNLRLYEEKGKSPAYQNGKIVLTGVPFSKKIKISSDNFSREDLQNALINQDIFSFSKEMKGKNLLLFANPFTSNIDLRKIKQIKNILGFAIPKELKDNQISDFYATSFLDGKSTGDSKAFYLKPREFVYIKMKDSSASLSDLEIGDEAKTFYYPRENHLENKDQENIQPKLCMEINQNTSAYIFVSKNLENPQDGLIQGEVLKLNSNKDSTNFWTLKQRQAKEIPLYINIIDQNWKENPINLVFYKGLKEEKSKIELKIINEDDCNCEDFYLKDHQKNEFYLLESNKKYDIYLPDRGEELGDRYQIYYKNSKVKNYIKPIFTEESPKEVLEKEENSTKICLTEKEIIIYFSKNIKSKYASLSLFNELNQLLYKKENIDTSELYKKNLSLKGRIHVKLDFESGQEKQINQWIYTK